MGFGGSNILIVDLFICSYDNNNNPNVKVSFSESNHYDLIIESLSLSNLNCVWGSASRAIWEMAASIIRRPHTHDPARTLTTFGFRLSSFGFRVNCSVQGCVVQGLLRTRSCTQ